MTTKTIEETKSAGISSAYLFNEPPLVVRPELARVIGLNEAIVLQQIRYWCNKNEQAGHNKRDGYTWTYGSYKFWQREAFSWWSVHTVRRIFDSLEGSGLLVSGRFNRLAQDRTKWYRIDDGILYGGRSEWLVDVGVAERVEPRTWRFTEAGLKLTELTQAYEAEMAKRYPENVMAAILDLWFFGYVSRAYGYMPSQNVGPDKFVTFIWPAYQQLAGVGSYCLFRPLLLYANILSLHNHQGLFLEYEEARKLLEDAYQSDPTALQYTIDRYNTDYQIRIERTPETGEH